MMRMKTSFGIILKASICTSVASAYACGPKTAPTESAVTSEHVIGNGGDAVVCSNGGKRTVELFDFIEGRQLRGLTPSLGDPSLQPLEKVHLALARLATKAPAFAQEVKEDADTFEADVRFVTVDLVDVSDMGEVILDPGCAVRQLAMQKVPELPLDKRYIVDKRLWDNMDNDHKAGLILHEVLYKRALAHGYETSQIVRYLNALIASADLAELSPEKIDQLLRDLGIADGYYFYEPQSILYWLPERKLPATAARDFCADQGFKLSRGADAVVVSDSFRASDIGQALNDNQVWTDWDASGTLTALNYPAWSKDDAADESTPLAFLCNRDSH